jgi:hypothetical protein
MKKGYALARVQCRSTGRLFDVQVEVDVDELLRMYAQAAIDNKQRKARVANGAIRLKAQAVQ